MRGLVAGVSLINQWIGPMLGYVDLGLSDEQHGGFAALSVQAQPLALDAVRAAIEGDLGAAAPALLDGLQPNPLIAGPIGQLHRSTLPDGTPVAVNIRYPAIADNIARDLAPATLAARLAAWFQGSRQLDALTTLLHDRVLQACDYALAAQRQERCWWLFANHPTVVVPTVQRAYCGASVLTTTLVEGATLDGLVSAHPDQATRDRAGQALFDFYLGALFEHGLYKCDPDGRDPFLADGRLAIVDFSGVRELEPAFVARLAALTHALWLDDRELLLDALVELGLPPSRSPDGARALLRTAYGPLLRDEVAAFEAQDQSKLAELLQRWRQAPEPILPAELFFVVRMAFGLATLLARLGARGNWYRRLQQLVQAYPTPVYDVALVEPGPNPIVMIRELRDATGLPLRELELFLTTCPRVVTPALPRGEAEALRLRLESAGARVEVRLARPSREV